MRASAEPSVWVASACCCHNNPQAEKCQPEWEQQRAEDGGVQILYKLAPVGDTEAWRWQTVEPTGRQGQRLPSLSSLIFGFNHHLGVGCSCIVQGNTSASFAAARSLSSSHVWCGGSLTHSWGLFRHISVAALTQGLTPFEVKDECLVLNVGLILCPKWTKHLVLKNSNSINQPVICIWAQVYLLLPDLPLLDQPRENRASLLPGSLLQRCPDYSSVSKRDIWSCGQWS